MRVYIIHSPSSSENYIDRTLQAEQKLTEGGDHVMNPLPDQNRHIGNEALNRKECREYIDIDCQFAFAEDATLTKHYDRILAYNGSTLITDYLKVFRVGGKVKEDEEEEE